MSETGTFNWQEIADGAKLGTSSDAVNRSSLNLLSATERPSPWDTPGKPEIPQPAPGGDKLPDKPRGGDVKNGILELTYGEPDFDKKLAQTNYNKLVIRGLPKELLPAPWVDEQNGKGYFFWLKNQRNPEASDRNRHYFPSNLKEIEIAQMAGNVYKPIMINADEMRISASQAYMKAQNQNGFASLKNATDIFGYAQNMSKVANQALSYQENLLREGAKSSPWNPYFQIYLADVLVAQAVQPIIQKMTNGEKAYFDNPETHAKIDEAIKAVQDARLATQRYGDIRKPPSYEMPLSPFSLNPYSYNPDYYWSGAAYQASIREVQLFALKQAIKLGKNMPIELPPLLPPKP